MVQQQWNTNDDGVPAPVYNAGQQQNDDGLRGDDQNCASTQTPIIAEVAVVSADDVGAAFVLQYFKIMKRVPDDLCFFYNNDSRVSRGTKPVGNNIMDMRHAVGRDRIRELLTEEHALGARLSLAIINHLEAQDSMNGSVIVQVSLVVLLPTIPLVF